MGLAKALRLTNGHYYTVSSACEGSVTARVRDAEGLRTKLEQGGGSALDWFYHELGVKYTYQIKLRDTGSYGFLLPKAHLVPTGQETFNALLALLKFLMSNKGIELDLDADMFSSRRPEIAVEGKEESNVTSSTAEPVPEHPATQNAEVHEEDDDWSWELRRRRRRR